MVKKTEAEPENTLEKYYQWLWSRTENHLVPERKASDGVEDVVPDQTPDVLLFLRLRLRIVTSVEDDDDILHGEARLSVVALGDVIV